MAPFFALSVVVAVDVDVNDEGKEESLEIGGERASSLAVLGLLEGDSGGVTTRPEIGRAHV